MFANLSDKILGSVRKLRGQDRISEGNIDEAIKEIRLSLLEADVNFKVVKSFIDSVKTKAIGQSVLTSVQPAQQFIKIVHDELKLALGGETVQLELKGASVENPAVIFLVGLQGAGKTTSAGKLSLYIKKSLSKKPVLVPADIYRPAAIEQLHVLARQLDVAAFSSRTDMNPRDILRQAKLWAREQMAEVIIVDTAGRLQIDETLMTELSDLKAIAQPNEILLVADAMLGQQSVNVAEGFHARLGLTGLVLTKIDGDARGGAALSIRQTVGVPIKFLGVGEKATALEVFHPDRLAGRILDMGDVVTLVERAQEVIDEKTARESAAKFAKNQFTMDDFLEQLQMMKKLGGMESILKMLPGMGQAMKQLEGMAPPDKEMKRIEAIIRSMTPDERANHKILNGSRRARIARGSGTHPSDINKFIKQFEQSQKMMQGMMKMGMGRGGKGPFGGGPFGGGGGRGFPFG
jgi:signal recognition particle subunit SRP54